MATTGVFSARGRDTMLQGGLPRTCSQTQSGNSAQTDVELPFLVGLGLALTTSLLLFLSFFPVNCGWLCWLALVPWLVLVRSQGRPWRLYLLAWLSGLAFFWPVLQWMRVADPRMYATWAMLATYCSVYFPLSLWLLRWLDRRTRLPLVLTLPVVWVALEFLRGHAMTGFPWYFLAHTQHDFLPLIQISDLTGAYGVSFLVAAVNGLLFEILWQRGWFRPGEPGASAPGVQRKVALLGWAVLLLGVTLGALAYGVWQMGQDRQEVGPRLALLQGNMPQGVRNKASGPASKDQENAGKRAINHFFDLCDRASRFQTDLIVWPETCFPREWAQIARDHPPRNIPEEWQKAEISCQDDALAASQRWRTALLLGVNVYELQADNRRRRYNSALLIDPAGQIEGRYDKIHRVPFGEYVPLREWLPWMNRFSPYDYDYEVVSGAGHPALSIKGHDQRVYTFGTNICFEDTDPTLSRPYVAGGGMGGGQSPPLPPLVGRELISWSISPTTAGLTAPPSTSSTWPSAGSGPSSAGAAWPARSTWASRE